MRHRKEPVNFSHFQIAVTETQASESFEIDFLRLFKDSLTQDLYFIDPHLLAPWLSSISLAFWPSFNQFPSVLIRSLDFHQPSQPQFEGSSSIELLSNVLLNCLYSHFLHIASSVFISVRFLCPSINALSSRCLVSPSSRHPLRSHSRSRSQ